MAQPPSMMEKAMKVSKAKQEKKVKENTESPIEVAKPLQPAQSLQGKNLINNHPPKNTIPSVHMIHC